MLRTVFVANGTVALALVLGWRALDGSAFDLVQGWYRPLLLATVLLLGALAAWAIVPLLRSKERVPVHWQARSTAGGLIVAVPILVLAVFQPAPLGSTSLNRLAGDDALFAGLSIGSGGPADRNLFQWAMAFANEPPASLTGEPVTLVAFVHHAEDAGPDRFMAARFVVACCVADARGVVLPVEWPDASALATDAWVNIEGEVALSTSGEPFIRAHSVTVTDAPANPYLYP